MPLLDHSWELEVGAAWAQPVSTGVDCSAALWAGTQGEPTAGWALGCCGLPKAHFLGWSLGLFFPAEAYLRGTASTERVWTRWQL